MPRERIFVVNTEYRSVRLCTVDRTLVEFTPDEAIDMAYALNMCAALQKHPVVMCPRVNIQKVNDDQCAISLDTIEGFAIFDAVELQRIIDALREAQVNLLQPPTSARN